MGVAPDARTGPANRSQLSDVMNWPKLAQAGDDIGAAPRISVPSSRPHCYRKRPPPQADETAEGARPVFGSRLNLNRNLRDSWHTFDLTQFLAPAAR